MILLRPAAAADLESGYRWFEQQGDGLGHDFLAGVRTTLDAIEANPAAYPVVHRDTRSPEPEAVARASMTSIEAARPDAEGVAVCLRLDRIAPLE